jgi:hypothetical protein
MATNQGNSNQGGNKASDQDRQSGNQDNSNRGFASMDPQQQREIAAEGGRAAHAAGTAHEFSSEEARKAGSMSHKNDGNRQSGAEDSGSRGSSGGNQGSSGGAGGRGSNAGSKQ